MDIYNVNHGPFETEDGQLELVVLAKTHGKVSEVVLKLATLDQVTEIVDHLRTNANPFVGLFK